MYKLAIYPEILEAVNKKCKDSNLTKESYIQSLLDGHINKTAPAKTGAEQREFYIHKGFNLITPLFIKLNFTTERTNSEILQLLMNDLADHSLRLWFMSCMDKKAYDEWWQSTMNVPRPKS